MVDWSTSSEAAAEAAVFSKLVFCLFGLYAWEVFKTVDFEWSFFTGRRKFSWPLVFFFFICRYFMLATLAASIAGFSPPPSTNCHTLFVFITWTANMTILSATTSLMLRVVALWERDKRVAYPLTLITLAHWIIVYRGLFAVEGDYSMSTGMCAITSTDHSLLTIGFFATVFVNLVLFILASVALYRRRPLLVEDLYEDGFPVFFLTVFCTIPPAVLSALNLNAMMDIISFIPSITFITIATCRLVMSLPDWDANTDPYVHTAQQMVAANATRGQLHFGSLPRPVRTNGGGSGVMVTTDQIVMDDFSPASTARSKVRRFSKAVDVEAGRASDSDQDCSDNGFKVKTAF